MLALGLGAPAAHAQTSHDHDQNAGGGDSLTRTAVYHGYSEGYGRGAADLKSAADFRAQTDEIFLRALTGYTRDMGPVAQYQSAYRQAYAEGYSDGYRGRDCDLAKSRPPSPLEPGSRNEEYGPRSDGLGGTSLGVASAKGYEAGYKQGAEDGKHGLGYGYRDEEVYRAATDGYDPSLGDEKKYQMTFRQIYSRGYSDGFHGRARYTDPAVRAYEPRRSARPDAAEQEPK